MTEYRPRAHTQERFDRVIDLARQGRSGYSIAIELGEHLTTVQRWIKRSGVQITCETREVGLTGESLVAAKLQALGVHAVLMGDKSPYDIDAEGVRVEVKTASCYRKAHRSDGIIATFHTGKDRYSLYGHVYAKDYKADCDFMVFVWLGDHRFPQMTWIRPASRVCRGTNITLNFKPGDHRNRWEQDLNNWAPILSAVKASRERAA